MNYQDFVIKIGAGNEGTYPVTVLFSRQEDMKKPELSRFPFNEAELQTHLVALQAALVPSGVIAPKEVSPEAKVQLFGQRLFEMLFAGEVGNLYRISLARATSQREGLRVRLRIVPPELAALPWEFLYDHHHNRYLSLFPATPVVRYPEVSHPGHEPLAVALPLQILGMVVSPNDIYPALDVEEEKARFEKALESLRKTEQVNLTWVEGQTWENLRDALWHGKHHIFHFIGHGNFDGFKGEGFLALAREDGTLHRLYAKQLAYLLMGVQSLRLVFLGACKGAQATKQDLVSSVAASLVDQGLPAVVAMQYDITDNAAIELDKTFYKALAKGWPVERCLAESRRAVEIACGGGFEWGIPVLYLRAADGVLFDLQQGLSRSMQRLHAPPPSTPLAQQSQLETLYQDLLQAELESQWEAVIELGGEILRLDNHHEATRTKSANAYYHRGILSLNKEDYEGAIADFSRAIELDSGRPDFYQQRGVSYHHEKDYKRAIADYSRAIKLDPTRPDFYWERGKSYARTYDSKRAIADYSRAIELDSTRADFYYLRGVSYHAQGDYERAIADKSQAIALDPTRADFHYSRGLSHKAQGTRTLARKDFKQAAAMGHARAKAELERLG